MSDNLINVSKSRIAKSFVVVPSSVKIEVANDLLKFYNSANSLYLKLHKGVDFSHIDGKLFFVEKSSENVKFAGTLRAVSANFIKGLTEGFSKTLKLVGVGFKASVSGNKINMNLGYSHPVEFELPNGVSAVSESATVLKVSSHDPVLLGDVVAKMCRLRKRDSYKGKGVINTNAQYVVALKEGKKK